MAAVHPSVARGEAAEKYRVGASALDGIHDVRQRAPRRRLGRMHRVADLDDGLRAFRTLRPLAAVRSGLGLLGARDPA